MDVHREKKENACYYALNQEQFYIAHCINFKDHFQGFSLVDWTLCIYEEMVGKKQNWILYALAVPPLEGMWLKVKMCPLILFSQVPA